MDRRESRVRRRYDCLDDDKSRRRRYDGWDEAVEDALFRRKLYGGSWFAYDYAKKS